MDCRAVSAVSEANLLRVYCSRDELRCGCADAPTNEAEAGISAVQSDLFCILRVCEQVEIGKVVPNVLIADNGSAAAWGCAEYTIGQAHIELHEVAHCTLHV